MSGNGAGGSSIGTKAVMAVTGLGLLLFVIAHMLGNLQLFLGPEPLNAYAKKLKDLPWLLWPARIGLLAIFALHVGAALRLTFLNRRARPSRYEKQSAVQVGMAARTLILSGLVVLAFVGYHLLHFTFGVTHPEHFDMHDSQGRHDVHAMVVLGFSEWPVALSYVVANLVLALHLSHGIASLFQTLGLNDPALEPGLLRLGRVVAFAIALGNVSMPVAVWLGFLGPAGGS